MEHSDSTADSDCHRTYKNI